MATPRPVINADGPPDIPGALTITATFDGFEIAGRGRYDVVIELADRLGVWECVALTIRHQAREARIDGDVLRRIRVADLVRAAAAELEDSGLAEALAQRMVPTGSFMAPRPYRDRWTGEVVAPSMSAEEHDALMQRRDEALVKPARVAAARFRRMVKEAARAGGETRLRAAAEVYKRAARAGRPPTKAVEQELGITYAAAVSLVRRCRAAGMLAKTKPGAVSISEPPQGQRRRSNGK